MGVASSVLERNSGTGVVAFGCSLDYSERIEQPVHLDDLGGNMCGCDGAVEACVAQSANVAPPEPIGGSLEDVNG